MPAEIEIEFFGPFSWPGADDAPSIFTQEVARQPGIYLWAVRATNGYLIWYVGETGREFKLRLLEHYQEHAAGMYHLYEPGSLAFGSKVEIWPGRYDSANRKSIAECIAAFPSLSGSIHTLTSMYRFFVAPLACEPRMRKRIESAIADALYACSGVVGEFQERGIRYHRRSPHEEPVRVTIRAGGELLGLPEGVLA